jgi:hypothetical protein
MASLQEMFEQGVADLGGFAGMWNPFSIIDAKGLDGHAVFSPMLSRLIGFGASLLVLMALLRVVSVLTDAMAGRKAGLLGFAAETVLVGALLVSYPEWIRILPQVFTVLGRNIQAATVQDLGSQVAGALAQMGDERASDFKLWSSQAVELGVGSLMAALASTLALVALWVVAKLQAYVFTFWYLLGPVVLPTLVYPPLRHVGRIWLATMLGVAFMGTTGPLLLAILVRSQWIPHAFSAGGALDAVTCLVFSLLILATLISVPVLSLKVWAGIEGRVMPGMLSAAGGASDAAAALQGTASRARAAYATWRGTSPSTGPAPASRAAGPGGTPGG